MSIGSEIAYRRSARGKDATGSLVFDAERRKARNDAGGDRNSKAMNRSEKKQIG